jgi:hypothetical protein
MPLQQLSLVAIGGIFTAGSRGTIEVVGEEDFHYLLGKESKFMK